MYNSSTKIFKNSNNKNIPEKIFFYNNKNNFVNIEISPFNKILIFH